MATVPSMTSYPVFTLTASLLSDYAQGYRDVVSNFKLFCQTYKGLYCFYYVYELVVLGSFSLGLSSARLHSSLPGKVIFKFFDHSERESERLRQG